MPDDSAEVLLVDDEETLIHAFEKLSKKYSLNLNVAKGGLEAMSFLGSNRVDVALLDLNLPGCSGMQVLEYIKKNRLDCEAIIITGRGSVETAVSSLKMGAYDYLVKPFDDFDRVASIILKAQEKSGLLRKIRELEKKDSQVDSFGEIVGKSRIMQEVYTLIESVALSHSSVLVMGESGTGKEMVARSIHEKSFRREKAFVVVNCAAIPETLLESELFGHVRGAFTGAVGDKKGLFEEADGGTIFLDEIGELPPSMQVKLLRVLQDGELRRVGGGNTIHVDVRLLSATNKDLYQLARSGGFREDLFYRLNVITLRLPPLRERREDLPLLSYYFMRKYTQKMGKEIREITLDAIQSLTEYSWPGNVRELENVMERAVVLATGDRITARDLPPKILGEVFYAPVGEEEQDITRLPYDQAKERALRLFNRSYISYLLRQTGGNISLASSKAGMDRSNFKKIIKKCDLNVGEFKKRRGV